MSDKHEPTPAPENAPMAEEQPTAGEAGETPTDASAEWEKKYNELQDQFTRLAADFDNFRKRAREEQEATAQYGFQRAVEQLLPVLDNLDRATASLNENSDPKVLFQSFSVMQKQLGGALEKMGVQKIPAVGQPFNPEYHEAVSRLESADVPEDTIMYEAQSGYMLNDKVIRPALVAVSAGSGNAAEAPTAPPPQPEAAPPSNPFKGT